MNINSLIDEAQFLCDRLDDLDWSITMEEHANDFSGHVDPSLYRLKQYLSQLSPAAAATGQWQEVGTFEPDPYANYLVMGTMVLSVKKGADIDPDNIAAALITLP